MTSRTGRQEETRKTSIPIVDMSGDSTQPTQTSEKSSASILRDDLDTFLLVDHRGAEAQTPKAKVQQIKDQVQGPPPQMQ